MPGLNGYALVARIRAKWPSMVILTTGYLSQDAAKNMMNGSVDFIPKPIDPEKLLEIIHRRLSTEKSLTADKPLLTTRRA
jgi:DNA-binding NtrC family response regulator